MSDTSQFLAMPDVTIDQADILLLPIPLERTVSFKSGTAEAPKAILDTTEQLEFYEEDAGWSPFKHMKLSVLPDFTDDRSLSDAKFHSKLTEYVASLPKDNLFIGLGGEHSLSPSLVEARMPEPGTVLFLDAHADMRTSYGGSKYSHACPVTRLLDQGQKIVMAGIRSIYESEVKVIEKNPRLSLFLDWDLRGKGQWEGFFWYQMIEVLETLFSRKEIDLRGVDMVEIVPEPSRVSEMTAAKLLLKIISFWGFAKEFNLKPEVGNQKQMDYE
jgi:agmatinase